MKYSDVIQGTNGPLTISADSVAGAGSGMMILYLAQSLPDGTAYKSWIITMVPVITLVIKRCWSFCEPDIVFLLKNGRANIARSRCLRRIDELMNDPAIQDDIKADLSDMKMHARVSSVLDLYKYWKASKQVQNQNRK